MVERMNQGRADALVESLLDVSLNQEGRDELASEFVRARQWEQMSTDRIHALEGQQADLNRQMKEKDAAIARLVNGWKDEALEKDRTINALADALEAERTEGCRCEACTGSDAALRLAGRMK